MVDRRHDGGAEDEHLAAGSNTFIRLAKSRSCDSDGIDTRTPTHGVLATARNLVEAKPLGLDARVTIEQQVDQVTTAPAFSATAARYRKSIGRTSSRSFSNGLSLRDTPMPPE